jgi:hypothetical protein
MTTVKVTFELDFDTFLAAISSLEINEKRQIVEMLRAELFSEQVPQPRTPGQYAGKLTIPEDFNEP